MLRKIYHGSNHIIKSPQFGAGKPYNDYGLGFYCTEIPDLAKEWGVSDTNDGFANCYTIDCSELYILNLNDSKYCILHWLTILLENRTFDVSSSLAYQAKEYLTDHFGTDYKNADCVIGYRADDSYFSFAADFISGALSYSQLNQAMHLGKLGQQFVIKSKNAFRRLKFIGYEVAEADIWYPKKIARSQKARDDYFANNKDHFDKNGLYITQILREEMKPDDPRLR
jgi:hypothetical protein